MIRLARWCFAHRRSVVAGWLLAMVAVLGLGRAISLSQTSGVGLSVVAGVVGALEILLPVLGGAVVYLAPWRTASGSGRPGAEPVVFNRDFNGDGTWEESRARVSR
ncbi:MAG: hypothetical protein ACQSGP_03865 [Frankia sp.]